MEPGLTFTARPGRYQRDVDAALDQIRREQVVKRIWEKDASLWPGDPQAIRDRLGWLACPATMLSHVDEIDAFAEHVADAGFEKAYVLGMGGSSLAPEVFARIFSGKESPLALQVLDSTHPDEIVQKTAADDLQNTLYIVSTKSGSTIETLSLMKYCFNRLAKEMGPEKAGKQFVAITDPGSALADMARDLGFLKTFLNDPTIGGRFSALSYFGLAPAALAGVDISRILRSAGQMAKIAIAQAENNIPVLLGAILAALAAQGREKVTLMPSSTLAPFGAWFEQLLAESTGKAGQGLLPVIETSPKPPGAYAHDRLFVFMGSTDDPVPHEIQANLAAAGHPIVQLTLGDSYDLGGAFFCWEMAVAVAGNLMGINPFDQPDVESAKIQARHMMATYEKEGALPKPASAFESADMRVFADFQVSDPDRGLHDFLSAPKTTDKQPYAAILAFLPQSEETDSALEKLREKIENDFGLAVTVGYGPRFLHSTGQLHKGDAGNGLFIQLTAGIDHDIAIPDSPRSNKTTFSFGVLNAAQALGDRQALMDAGRKVICFDFKRNVVDGMRHLWRQ